MEGVGKFDFFQMINEFEFEVLISPESTAVWPCAHMDRPGIYGFNCEGNGRSYIGSTKNLKTRLKAHISAIKNDKHGNRFIRYSSKKYGISSFRFFVIKTCELSELVPLEDVFIEKNKSLFNQSGFNFIMARNHPTGPKGPSGLSPKRRELIKRLAGMRRGKAMPSEWKESIRIGHLIGGKSRVPWWVKKGLPNPFKGKKRIFTQAHKNKMSRSAKAAFASGSRIVPNKTPSHLVDKIISLIISGKTRAAVAKELGVGQTCVSSWAIKRGIILK